MQQYAFLNRLLQRYDRVLLRYPMFDGVGALMIRDYGRIISEHHSPEPLFRRSETQSRFWHAMESAGGARWIRRFGGLVAPTPELVEYEVARSGFKGRTAYFPNSILLDDTHFASGAPIERGDKWRLCVVVANFLPMYGLDVVLEGIRREPAIELHVAGSMDATLEAELRRHPQVVYHGVLSREGLNALYARMHAGLVPFFPLRQGFGIDSATPIKTREYLAYGLPVIGSYRDAALPENFPYFLRTADFDAAGMTAFLQALLPLKREAVREAARPYVDARRIVRQTYDFCTSA